MLYHTWIAEHHTMRRYIHIYIRVRCYQNIIANSNFTDYSRIDSNPDFIADNWRTFLVTSVALTDHNTFVDIAIFSYDSIWVNGNIKSMPKIQALPDLSLW